MEHPILGLHHVTATADGAQEDLDFYAQLLGLRLVKQTVNFDNHNVYHFYYGNQAGSPGTLWTTFPYRGWGVPIGIKGSGQITVTSFSVPAGSLDFWKSRLRAQGVVVNDVPPRFGEESIAFGDLSGLTIELVANNADERIPWLSADVARPAAIRGLHSVTLTLATTAGTTTLIRDVLGFEMVAEAEHRWRLGVGGDGPGQILELVLAPDAPAARNGTGTVHHVALAVADPGDQLHLRGELTRLGYQVTEVLDRQYFRSIYFREPGGVLFEIATVKPGFTVDEDLAGLGGELRLPPWEEPNRSTIEAGLPAVVLPTLRGVAPPGSA